MKTTTAKFQRTGQKETLISSAVNYQGYLSFLRKVGAGKSWETGGMFNGEGDSWTEWERYEDRLCPCYDGFLLPKEKIKEAEQCQSVQQAIEKGFAPYLLKWGVQDGYTVTDLAQERADKEAREQELIAQGETPINFTKGIMGLRIAERLPASVWAKVKPYAEYIKPTDDMMEHLDDQGHYDLSRGDVAGWHYKAGAIDALASAGLLVHYRGEPVSSAEDMQRINQLKLDENEAYVKRSAEVNGVACGYKEALADLFRKGEYISQEEARQIKELPQVRLLDWQGANIYGSGKWLHIQENDLYLVVNNGMDGDDWGRNNYPTGGAGAIACKAAGMATLVTDIQDWLAGLSAGDRAMIN